MKALFMICVCMVLTVSSCKKDFLTDGQRAAQHIQSGLAIRPNIKKASFYVSNIRVDYSVDFIIDGEFVVTANGNYNLARLISYEYGKETISFYF